MFLDPELDRGHAFEAGHLHARAEAATEQADDELLGPDPGAGAEPRDDARGVQDGRRKLAVARRGAVDEDEAVAPGTDLGERAVERVGVHAVEDLGEDSSPEAAPAFGEDAGARRLTGASETAQHVQPQLHGEVAQPVLAGVAICAARRAGADSW